MTETVLGGEGLCLKESVLALLGVGFSVCQKLYWRLPEVKIADPDDTNKASENTNIASMDRNTASGDAHSLTDFLKKISAPKSPENGGAAPILVQVEGFVSIWSKTNQFLQP